MKDFFTLEEITNKTGLSKSRLRYIEARFPITINRRLFAPDGQLYSLDQIKEFKNINQLIDDNDTRLYDYIKKNSQSKKGKIIAFASGKGGVGKTSLSINLSLLALKFGYKIAYIDGDLGMADSHILLGINPNHTIHNLFTDGLSLNEIIIKTPFGLDFIAGGNGLGDLTFLNDRLLNILSEEFKLLQTQYDYIFIDSPAGVGKAVYNWINASNDLIIVTTPSPTSLLDAYGLIKILSEKTSINSIYVIVNLVKNSQEGKQTFHSLNSCTNKFLNRSLLFLGSIHKNTKFEHSIYTRKPFVVNNKKSIILTDLIQIIKKYLKK